MFKQLTVTVTAFAVLAVASAKTPVVDPYNLPYKADGKNGQTGINQCTKTYGASSQDSMCQNVIINGVKDFCLWAPAKPNSVIGDVEAEVVSWCTRKGYGSRLIPSGAIHGAQFLKTPSYVQVVGTGDLTQLNIKRGDDGGELDPHGADRKGNPIGGLVFTKAFSPNRDTYQQIMEWNSFISYNEFCFRACIGDWAHQWCNNIYENTPGRYYDNNIFESCHGTEGQWPGVYQGSTWYQGVSPTPGPQPAGESSECKTFTALGYGKKAKHPLGRCSLEKRQAPRATMMPRAPVFDDME